MTKRDQSDDSAEWLTMVHAYAQTRMLAALLRKYHSTLPFHVRDDLWKSALKRARLIVEQLERGDGRDLTSREQDGA